MNGEGQLCPGRRSAYSIPGLVVLRCCVSCKPIIAEVMGAGVTLVDSAAETALTVAEILARKKMLRPASEIGNHHYYVSDIPAGFIRVGNRFLGGRLGDVYQVNLDEDGEGN